MKHHTHPETYSPSDPLGLRVLQLHTSKDQCDLSWCTFAEHYEWAKQEHIDRAKALKAELKAAGLTKDQAFKAYLAHPNPGVC